MLTYANQMYNKNIVQGVAGYDDIYSDIVMLQLTHKFSGSKSIRTEFQHLSTRQDHDNWAMALAEVGLGEHWMISASDLYNYGNHIESDRIHYYNATVVYIKGPTRMGLGYGKQRAGIFCVGGVCRYVPASNGITLSVTTSF